ncbi:hypothetical protein JYT83_01455, partial [bacterium AH-315-F18]|nr:hypothetical protein [bacterium AH-315-F18]
TVATLGPLQGRASTKPALFGRSVENRNRAFLVVDLKKRYKPKKKRKTPPMVDAIGLNTALQNALKTMGKAGFQATNGGASALDREYRELMERLPSWTRYSSAHEQRNAAKKKAKEVEEKKADKDKKTDVAKKEEPKPTGQADAAHWYRLSLAGQTTAQAVSATASPNLFKWQKTNNALFVLLFSLIIVAFISVARKKDLFLRRIPGLDAIDEAIGRATEMGRPIYYMTGRDDIDSVPTIAATIILASVAKKVAEYDAELKVPHTRPMVMALCQEITHEAYISAGRPDAYQESSNFFITDDQFSYAAAVDGMMMREKPAAVFYMGYYYAESLLMAETGAACGAIQVAGTDADHQLPFFITACDYTLIGEELYAAGAYLSKQPVLVGTLRGQDIAKAVVMVAVGLGSVLLTVSVLVKSAPESINWILDIFKNFGG